MISVDNQSLEPIIITWSHDMCSFETCHEFWTYMNVDLGLVEVCFKSRVVQLGCDWWKKKEGTNRVV